MTNYERFTEQEIPYGILQRFGLSQEMIDDLPQNVMQRFLSSRATPLLPITTENAEGEKVRSFARISLVRMEDGTIDIFFIPRWTDKNLNEFTEEQQQKLMKGEVTTAFIPKKGTCYIQFDEDISQVMMVPENIIKHNISILTRSFELDDASRITLEEGGVLEMTEKEQTASAGIDLKEMTGIRIANGNKEVWQQDAKADRLPKYNFGNFGCWIADDENILSYVFEDDFTPEMIEEQKRQMSMNAASAKMSQMKMS